MAYRVQVGDSIQGKWNGNRYVVKSHLGSGAIGDVYLVQGDKGLAALKISTNNTSITSEVNVFRSFSKVRGCSLGPYLLDVDDWIHPATRMLVSFYVMEYIEGINLYSFVQQRGEEWVPLLILQLLEDLEVLHQSGFVFGDLKPENLIVTEGTCRVRLLDVGGVTMKGRAIKEFTEFFDRGYWGIGTRKAEPSYDLFAVVMLMIAICYKGTYSKREGGYVQLEKLIQNHSLLRKVEKVLLEAVRGNYQSAIKMREELLRVVGRQINRKQGVLKKDIQSYGWREVFLVCSATVIGYMLYMNYVWL